MPNIYIVNHPIQEPIYVNKTFGAVNPILWNTSSKHKRKFMQREGLYLDKYGHLHHDLLYFWAEYEPYSDAIIVNNKYPRAVHTHLSPVMELVKPTTGLNTDPYIFGCFRNICCGRSKNHKYMKGDIIIFGHVIGNQKIEFDTVMVIDKHIDINSLSTTGQYYLASANPSYDDTYETFLEGIMYTPASNSFSFVPCLPSNNINPPSGILPQNAARSYMKPKLMLRDLGNSIKINGRGNGYIKSSDVINNPWDTIISAVFKNELELGVYIQPI